MYDDRNACDVKVRGITIDNNLRVPNNDAIHFWQGAAI